jgi:hypothetical protein
MSMDVFGVEEDPEPDSGLDSGLEPALESEPEPHDEDPMPVPRTIDAATWAARGIVVLTLGLVAVMGGLFLGVSVTDSTPSSARPSATTSSTATPGPTETIESMSEASVARVNAPAVKISTPGPKAAARTATATVRGASVPTTRATVVPAPTSAAPSPTSTATPRGKSTNTGKPKPTKP